MSQELDDYGLIQYNGWEWLGLDLKLEAGDLAFGSDGDFLAHADHILSFAQCLTYKSQVAGNLVVDVFPRRITIALKAAVRAIAADPRVESVRITNGAWYRDTNNKPDIQFYVVEVLITLTSGDVLSNVVLPIYGTKAE